MTRHISPNAFYVLPSGIKVHPNRLIHKDGTLMWKHAFLNRNELTCVCQDVAHEAHIIKTALRLEELNSWVSQGLDPWECLRPVRWYDPTDQQFAEGTVVQFYHNTLPANVILDSLLEHKQEYETLTYANGIFKFKRC